METEAGSLKSAITICLVPQARRGPFVFHGGLADGCSRVAKFGFDAVEIFPPSADAIDPRALRQQLDGHKLAVAAFGTGAGWLGRKLSLTAQDEAIRTMAREFIAAIIRLGGEFGAPAIIGSMQGKIAEGVEREQALDWLRDALDDLGQLAASCGTPLLLEPLNRYETNLFNRLGETAEFIGSLTTNNVRILADLFHMNIEEADMAAAIAQAAPLVGHVHFADSNRQAVGFGHTDISPVILALRKIGYTGYLSAEVFPLPTADAAAEQTIAAIRLYCK